MDLFRSKASVVLVHWQSFSPEGVVASDHDVP
jgi:hypothetical protein